MNLNVGLVMEVHLFSREQQKKLAAVEMDLAAARQAGFVLKHSVKKEDNHSKKKLLAVIGTSQLSLNPKNIGYMDSLSPL